VSGGRWLVIFCHRCVETKKHVNRKEELGFLEKS
jgi:hypothetical protein